MPRFTLLLALLALPMGGALGATEPFAAPREVEPSRFRFWNPFRKITPIPTYSEASTSAGRLGETPLPAVMRQYTDPKRGTLARYRYALDETLSRWFQPKTGRPPATQPASQHSAGCCGGGAGANTNALSEPSPDTSAPK